jgi:hypothetical protein
MLLPGLWVAFLALLLALSLRRWYDPVPPRCWLAWSAALAVLFGAVLLGGRTLLPLGYLGQVPPFTGLIQGEPPGNLLQSDLVLQIAPWLTRVQAAYAAGSWPLWNPLAGAGEPLLANPQSQALQPLVALALPFPVVAGFGVTAALRVLLAFVFTWLLLRRQGISETVALAGSLAYGLAGFLQLWLGWPIAGSAAFLPVLLYAITMIDQRGARRDSVLLALATASLLLVGHPETGLHVALLAAAFALSRLLARPAGSRLRLLGAWALAAGIGAGLAAPVALPAAEYLPKSQRAALLAARHQRLQAATEEEGKGENLGLFSSPSRGRSGGGPNVPDSGAPPSWPPPVPGGGNLPGDGLPFSEQTVQGLHGPLARLLPSAAPNAFGNNRFGGYWGDRNVIEDAAGFAGTAALLAALAAVWPLAAGRRFPQERLMLGTALVCLLVMARPSWLEGLFEAVPVLRDSQSFHSRVALLLDLAVAWLAACTWERWSRKEIDLRRLLPPATALALLIGWAYFAHPGPDPGAFARLRWGSLGLQLAALAVSVILLARPVSAFRASALTALIAAELIAFHAPAHPPVPASLYYPVTPPIAFLQERLDPWYRMAGMGPMLRPNFATVYGLADLRSSNPAKPAAFQEAIRRINRFPTRVTEGLFAPEDPLYPRLGARFVMTPPRMFLPKPYRLAFHRESAWIYQNREARPLLYLAPLSSTRNGGRSGGGLSGVRDLSLSGAPPPGLPLEGEEKGSSFEADSELELGTAEPEWLRARARLSQPRLLASSVYQDGNWKLLVDRTRRPTILADGPFAAARLPAGEADLDLLYRPGSFLAGLAVAAAALAAGAAFWVPLPQTAARSQTLSQGSA